mmetsp:Transcript_12718/g.20559  ORF Transcript_12718/g.20559 Transcript_12718/m.20559 type:complete len:310 (+) Transcript_12718:158-1087(+)|eukprot:CAMPEP_0203755350 /NCGR_PEP_ID=MMETSP0098-20131031/8815_1 /ASSEMBLY_ACC=CAM_ASM_000208 /TAXON_ID=96639 /ORGANISM=" , Strain NY0313808BC1" /LENGTH=309 /DNA_ID=CAMNT_0050646775 /DNA_START=490 /DNA_END=1419 /DNA_ORIENTATION=-
MPAGDYTIGREVGRGAFAAVYLGERKSDHTKVAIKQVLRKGKHSGVDWTALREIKMLQEMNTKNVVGLLDVFALTTPVSINMVMEFCPFDLKKVIDMNDLLLEEADIKSYMQMMLRGTAEMHKLWVLHRDLKPDNLLIGDDRQLKLADFGLARIVGDPDEEISYLVVTLPYRSPELLFGAKEYGVGVDIWSIGCIMAELMIRRIFLPGMSDEDQLGKIFYMFGTPTEAEWPKMKSLNKFMQFTKHDAVDLRQVFGAYSKESIDLLKKLMEINPAKRITASEALEHDYFKTGVAPKDAKELPFDKIVNKK